MNDQTLIDFARVRDVKVRTVIEQVRDGTYDESRGIDPAIDRLLDTLVPVRRCICGLPERKCREWRGLKPRKFDAGDRANFGEAEDIGEHDANGNG